MLIALGGRGKRAPEGQKCQSASHGLLPCRISETVRTDGATP